MNFEPKPLNGMETDAEKERLEAQVQIAREAGRRGLLGNFTTNLLVFVLFAAAVGGFILAVSWMK